MPARGSTGGVRRSSSIAALACLTALLLLPVLALGESACTAQCRPLDPDVNSGAQDPADDVNVVLYTHWFDRLNRAPMNTQGPEEVGLPDLNQGFELPTIVVHAGSACGACEIANVNLPYNEFSMFTLPYRLDPRRATGGLDYSAQDPAFDLRLGEGPIMIYAYLSAHALPTQNSSSGLGSILGVGAVPALRVAAQWETGRHPDRGELIARGTSDLVTIINQPGADTVAEIPILLNRFVDVIPRGSGTILTLRIYQVNEENPAASVEVVQADWRLRTGEAFPWRMIVPFENPIESSALSTWTFNGTLFARWSVTGAFGSYDVDDRSFTLVARSSDGSVERTLPPFQIERVPTHPGLLLPVEGVWSIPFNQLPESGEWTLSFSASNLQGTYTVHADSQVTLMTFSGANSTPGPDLLLLALAVAVGVAGFVRRRP